jgi:regulator of sigma E protease
MNFAWYALWFIVAVSLLVTVHEFGHYWVARRLGFKVLRFSVGFGRPLFSRIAGPDRTEYVIAAIPLGGYVKMLDEREGPVPSEDLARSFTRKPPWQRIAVLLAGPAFNIVFAILVLWGMFWVSGITEFKPVVGDVVQNSIAARGGLRSGDEFLTVNGTAVAGQRDVMFDLLDAVSSQGVANLTVRGKDGTTRAADLNVPDPAQRVRLTEPAALLQGLGFEFWLPPLPSVLGKILPGGPAQKAGLQTGDRITAINGEPVAQFRDIVSRVSAHPGETVTVDYERNGATHTVKIPVASERDGGKLIGRIQAGPPKLPDELVMQIELSPGAALGRAAEEAWNITALQGRLFWRMVLGQFSMKNLNGPLSIAEYAGDSAEAGVASFMGFLVLISLSLGFLNLLPIPILDGGQIVFQLVEWL